MYNLCRILQHVVNGFDNVSLAQHHSVIERHQLVFHVYAQPCHRLYSILKEEVKQLLLNIAFVSEQLAIQTFSKNLEHIRVLVADICTSKYKRYYLASVIARKVELKAMTPTHSSFSVSGNSLEYLIGISPEIMAYGYHRGINECYAGTSSESSQIKEEHELEEHAAFQLHKAVVRHGFRKIRLHRTLNKEQVVVLEIAECTEMEIQQNRHDFTVGQRCCTPSTLHSAIVFQQISCIFCIKMFAKLVYNTK